MTSLVERFRHWYEYERDCNAKSLAMLASVPVEQRGTPEFARAVGRMAHLVAARKRWLHRLGHFAELPPAFPPQTALADLGPQVAEVEAAWGRYLANLTAVELDRQLEWLGPDGKHYRWHVEGILTQTLLHAPYHRGQIAQLVALLGGQAVDTDYVYWSKPTILEPNSK